MVLVLFDELGRIQEVIETLEREENEWFLSLLEEGKMVHACKAFFSSKRNYSDVFQRKNLLFFVFTDFRWNHDSQKI